MHGIRPGHCLRPMHDASPGHDKFSPKYNVLGTMFVLRTRLGILSGKRFSPVNDIKLVLAMT